MKIAILTNFKELHPGYSLTSIVQDQVTTLQRYGHDVTVFVAEQYSDSNWPTTVSCALERSIPHPVLVDYQDMNQLSFEHAQTAQVVEDILVQRLKEYDIVITHDWVLTGWNLPYYCGLRKARDSTRHLRFLHWVHSIPSANFNWWNIRALGNNHKIIYPNKTDSLRIADAFRGRPGDVRVIPHIRDLRSFFEFDENSCKFIDQFPAVMEATIVQVYPASTDRLTAKRVRELIWLFKEFKQRKFSVCLVVANQWATKTQAKENIQHYKQIAHRNGLTDEELIFTSEFQPPKFETGVPRRMLRELMMCSNLFVFPSRDESFGLVLPEAVLSSGCLTVCNRSLDMLIEVSGLNGLFFEFGSYFRRFKAKNERDYYKRMADIIIARMRENDGIQARTFMRQTYNMDSIYRNYYGPILAEAKELWRAA